MSILKTDGTPFRKLEGLLVSLVPASTTAFDRAEIRLRGISSVTERIESGQTLRPMSSTKLPRTLRLLSVTKR